MRLWTEVDPADLTGALRVTAEAADTDVLAQIFPALYQDEVKFTWQVDQVLQDVAMYGEFDTESTIGKEGGRGEKTARLLPVSRKLPISEQEQVTDPARVLELAESKGGNVVAAIRNRLARARAKALFDARLDLNENKIKQDVDFERDAALSGFTLDLTGTDDPVELLSAMAAAVSDKTGVRPDVAVARLSVITSIGKALREAGYIDTAGVVSRAAINEVTDEHELPRLVSLETAIAGVPLAPSGTLAMAVSGGVSGRTVYGPTVESRDPRFNLGASERPGIIAGVYDEDDPPIKWVMGKAVALPILSNPNTTARATVTS